MANSLLIRLRTIAGHISGATSIEYAVVAAGVAVAVSAVVYEIGEPVNGMLGGVLTAWTATFGG